VVTIVGTRSGTSEKKASGKIESYIQKLVSSKGFPKWMVLILKMGG
jgi:hypothetical protein